MRMVKAFVAVQLLLAATVVFSSWKPVTPKPAVELKLYWDEKNDLNWSNFQPVRRTGEDAAMSSIAIESRSMADRSGVYIRVRASFDTQKSWVKHDCQNSYILNHEQMHYNIVELYARKLRKAISEKKFSRNNFNAEYNRLFDSIADEHEVYQDKYDGETNHSIDREEQIRWNAVVVEELASLEEYSSPLVKINFK